MIKYKKGQAAMEFLMTYGWAILAAIIVVGVLWYLIGNPSNLAGTQFQLSAPFSSGTAVALSASQIELEFRNGAAEQITVENITIKNCGSIVPSLDIGVGIVQNFTVACAGVSSGERFTGDITIYYTTGGSGTIQQQATGSISGRVP